MLSHDDSTHYALGYSRVEKVSIGDECFISMNSTGLCGVTIENQVIVGAGAVVTKDLPSNSIVPGSPASIIWSYSDYIEKNH